MLGLAVGQTAVAMLRNTAFVTKDAFTPKTRMSALWFLQLLVNKFGAASEQLPEGQSLLEVMAKLVNNCHKKSDLEVTYVYQTLAYLTAAALACFDRATGSLVDLMIDGLSIASGRKVARGFRILLAPSEIMNEQNFCIIRGLRKQRLYSLTVSRITTLWRESVDKQFKENCLVALASILCYMDVVILTQNAAEIFPLILEGTNVVGEEATKIVCIETLATLVPECPLLVEEYLDSIIARMTDRTHNTPDSPSDATPRCRAKALSVLSLLTEHVSLSFPNSLLYKPQSTHGPQRKDRSSCPAFQLTTQAPHSMSQ